MRDIWECPCGCGAPDPKVEIVASENVAPTWAEIPSRRDLFAAMAMQGLLAAVYSSKEMLADFTTDHTKVRSHLTGCEAITRNALSYADALIAALALEKKEGDSSGT